MSAGLKKTWWIVGRHSTCNSKAQEQVSEQSGKFLYSYHTVDIFVFCLFFKNISTTIRCIAMRFSTDIYGTQKINPTVYGDPLIFSLQRYQQVTVKYLNIHKVGPNFVKVFIVPRGCIIMTSVIGSNFFSNTTIMSTTMMLTFVVLLLWS